MATFDYYCPNLPAGLGKALEGRSNEAFAQEIEERTALLHKLGYSKEQTVARIKANLAWEFDATWTKKAPAFIKTVDKIVTAYYKKLAGKRG